MKYIVMLFAVVLLSGCVSNRERTTSTSSSYYNPNTGSMSSTYKSPYGSSTTKCYKVGTSTQCYTTTKGK